MFQKTTYQTDCSTNKSLDGLVEGFAAFIAGQGYMPGTIKAYRLRAVSLCNTMSQNGVAISDLDDPTADALIEGITRAVSPSQRKHVGFCLERFRDYLIEHAAAPKRVAPPVDASPRACLRREYRIYLKQQRGLTDDTIYHCLRFYDRFLTYKFGDAFGELDDITAKDITSFILKLREGRAAPRDKTVPSHLRNLFKFLFWSGRTQRDLSRDVPKTRQPKPTNIPRYLSPDEVNRLIQAARAHAKTGRRNYAMLLLIARLGLRAPEVVAIELDDIDWRSGEILIRGKRQLHDRMPLPSEVGKAIVDYIQNERQGPDRALFVSTKAPFRRFKDAQILRWILQAAYDATGISPPQSYVGSHILRHSLATDMLRKGASLDDIGDVLRHRSPTSTTIYAQHDVEALRAIARPWPVEGGVQ